MNVWIERTLLIMLAPLLAIQGVYTRRVTPKLPEPPGPREGRAGQGSVLKLLIVGDSAAAGVGVEHQHNALAGQLVAALAPQFELHWKVIAQTGYTTRDVLRRLEHEPGQAFDLVVLSLGVNDVTSAVRTGKWLAQQRDLLALLQQRFLAQHVIVNGVPPMERFTALAQPLRAILGARAHRFNASLASVVDQWPGCELVRPTLPSGREALADDGFHPGRSAYREWARHLAERIAAWERGRRVTDL
ncbi:SGNH/GDSL hydrolase family protein [Paraburkholderia sp. J94]|uniref:SGNH/GDSL hydrolase family protein n=1 Tax=Paraburkholderia sp. J94 TaxID=2805441 RepID=UPI002AB28147|nr:SGNH/GDSL hydrolase family protein [Paraburkholderia sp. J94]